MKILFLSHFREGSDWSHRAIEYAMSMIEAGIDLAIRDISVTNRPTVAELPLQLVQLEQKKTSECEVCIQYILPHLLATNSAFKNIAVFALESASIRDIIWFRHLQIMDEVWVPNSQLKSVLEDSKIGLPVTVFFQPTQANVPSNAGKVHMGAAEANFKFYYIGGMLDRDNIESVIRCFHSEFHRSEQVSLVLHPHSAGQSAQQATEMINKKSHEIKNRLRMYKNPESYHKEITITEPMNEEGILALHNSCDCFISVPHADSWSTEAIRAMAHGNTPIVSACGGNLDFVNPFNPHTGSLVAGHYSVCNSSTPPFDDLETGKESWFIPCEDEVKSLMRYYYEHRDQDHSKDGIKQAKKFSRKNIGNKIKEYLNG